MSAAHRRPSRRAMLRGLRLTTAELPDPLQWLAARRAWNAIADHPDLPRGAQWVHRALERSVGARSGPSGRPRRGW